MRRARFLLLSALLAAGAAAATSAAAQEGSCTFERCGLRAQGTSVFRGLGDDLVVRTGSHYPDVRFLEAAGDSIAMLGRAARADAERAIVAAGVAGMLWAPAAVLIYGPGLHGVVDDAPTAETWTALGMMVAGYIPVMLSSRWRERVPGLLSRAVWRYNRAVAAGAVSGHPPELPPLDPAHFGRTGFKWGLLAGVVAASFLTRNARPDEDVWIEGFVVPWAGAAAGWVAGRMVPRNEH